MFTPEMDPELWCPNRGPLRLNCTCLPLVLVVPFYIARSINVRRQLGNLVLIDERAVNAPPLVLTHILVGDDAYTWSGDGPREGECSLCLAGPGLHAFIGRSRFGPLLMVLQVDWPRTWTVQKQLNWLTKYHSLKKIIYRKFFFQE